MEKEIKILKEKGIRATPQRLSVLRLLGGRNKHLTAEDIYGKIKVDLPSVSLATVYVILDLFKKNGLVARRRIRPQCTCYEARLDRHHHFLCRKCLAVIDLDMPPCAAFKCKEVEGNRIEDVHGYFYGLCARCRKD